MKITNIMNFVRTFEPRDAEVEKKLFDMAKSELDLSLEMDLASTFLLEYDALCDERYVEMYRAVADNPKIEIGLWYEIVEPLTSAIGIPYDSKRGYRWDWNISPGYPMSYPLEVRKALIDEAMRKFKEIFGFYPRSFGSWVLDTYTVNHLCDNYEIDALLVCRDQVATDAYTLVGGYFSGAYYPSRNNVFTPGTGENMIKVPVFRLLGCDPIHNLDSKKYLSSGARDGDSVYTLEPAAPSGADPVVQDWFFDTYYTGEGLGLAYTQIGQENSFASMDLITPLRSQYEKLIDRGVTFMTTGATGRLVKEAYASTPVTSVSALKNWDTPNAQTVYYSSESYVANILNYEGRVAIRALYLFDDRVADHYLTKRCTTFDSVHENLPIVDTYYQRGDGDGGAGIILAGDADEITVTAVGEDALTVCFDGGRIELYPDRIIINGCGASFTPEMTNTHIRQEANRLVYLYKGNSYALSIEGGELTFDGTAYHITGERVALIPTRL